MTYSCCGGSIQENQKNILIQFQFSKICLSPDNYANQYKYRAGRHILL